MTVGELKERLSLCDDHLPVYIDDGSFSMKDGFPVMRQVVVQFEPGRPEVVLAPGDRVQRPIKV